MLKLLGSTAAAGFVTACVPPAAPAAPGAAAPAQEGTAASGFQFPATGQPFAGRTLNVTLVAEGKPEALKQYVAEYQELSGATVNLETLPYPTLQEKQFTELTQQSGASDIVHVDCVWMGQYAGQGWLHPVDEFVQVTDPAILDLPDFHPNVLSEQSTWEDVLYGLPFINAVHAFYYRPDYFEKYGVTKVPETWEELRETARLISEQGAADGVAGVTFMGKRGVQLLCNWVGMFGSFGGDWYTEDYVSTLDTPESIASLDFFTTLVPYANPGVLSQDYDECAQTFADGKAAMNLQWENAAPWFADPERSSIVGKWQITMQPGVAQADGSIKRSPTFGGWNMGISADSQNKELAWDFIVWATTKEMEKRLASAQPPARMSVLSDPELQAQFIEYPTMLASLDVAKGRPRIPPWPQMADLIEGALSEAMTGAKTAEQALTEVNPLLNDILQEAGLQS
jgi:ABC-type glycerol-3-phosphate transport system substrate-binding protein